VTVTDILSVGVSPASPHAGAAANVTVTGSAACNAVQIDYGDGSVLQYSFSALPYTSAHGWAAPGTFSVVATGTGSCSRRATTTPPVVATVPPTVSLTSPAAGAAYNAPASVTLAANAADSDGTVTRVDFYANGALIGSSASAPYGFTWSNVAASIY